MRKNGMTVWWYERDDGSLGSHHFSTLPNNGSYEAEAHNKYARDAVRMVTVHDSGLGWDAFQALKLEASQYKKLINARSGPASGV
ncbi:MAG: hypothetical protein EON84_13675 [Bradyrhizobiaceae bacterium]|nr:MAG: hypothetical protein EON84_13675 [Bradyrhizobiaceae bacterium]